MGTAERDCIYLGSLSDNLHGGCMRGLSQIYGKGLESSTVIRQSSSELILCQDCLEVLRESEVWTLKRSVAEVLKGMNSKWHEILTIFLVCSKPEECEAYLLCGEIMAAKFLSQHKPWWKIVNIERGKFYGEFPALKLSLPSLSNFHSQIVNLGTGSVWCILPISIQNLYFTQYKGKCTMSSE
jgi:hypothetical protein